MVAVDDGPDGNNAAAKVRRRPSKQGRSVNSAARPMDHRDTIANRRTIAGPPWPVGALWLSHKPLVRKRAGAVVCCAATPHSLACSAVPCDAAHSPRRKARAAACACNACAVCSTRQSVCRAALMDRIHSGTAARARGAQVHAAHRARRRAGELCIDRIAQTLHWRKRRRCSFRSHPIPSHPVLPHPV